METLLPISQSLADGDARADHAVGADARAVADLGARADHHAGTQHHIPAQPGARDRSASSCAQTASDASG